MVELIKRMMALQAELEDTDGEFAKRIGVAQRMISYLYALERKPGNRVLGGLLVAFPGEFEDLVLDFLREQAMIAT